MFSAIVRITGAGRLAEFRERLRWLMVRDPQAEDYTEHHGEGVLEYRFTPQLGIPFPAFTLASSEFPELRVEAQWQHDGEQGRAVIESGRLVEQASAAPAGAALDVELGEEGRLTLAMACRSREGELIGYAAASDRHTYFRFAGGELRLVEPAQADAALEEVAFGLADEWLWYDEQDAPLERERYAAYGYPVRGANLKSAKLALLRGILGRSPNSGARYSSLDEPGRRAREALIAQWLRQT